MNRNLLVILMWMLAASAPDMSIKDVAEYLGVTKRTVNSMVADGRLTAYKLGYRIIRFRRSEIDASLQPVETSAEPVADIAPKPQRRGVPPRRRREPVETATEPVADIPPKTQRRGVPPRRRRGVA
jgi:excisionase family DNA binding protein